MAGKPSEQFKIRFDDDPSDLNYVENMENRKIERLSRRFTFFSILMPIILLGVVLFVYKDARKRVDQTQKEGNTGVLNLSKNLESRFSRLSIKQAELGEMLNKRFKILQEVTTQIEEELSKTEKALQETDAFLTKQLSKKTDEKTMTNKLSAFNETIQSAYSQLKKNVVVSIEKLEKDVEAVRNDLTLDLAVSTEAIENTTRDIKKINKDISNLSENQIDKSSIDRALTGQKEYIRHNINQIKKLLSENTADITDNKKNIDLDQDKILELKRHIRSLEKSMVNMRKKWDSAKKMLSKQPSRQFTRTPKQSGTILELNIE